MKLRNKKTGERKEINDEERDLFDLVKKLGLLEDWEIIEEKEPLINDEKIRKAVRAWAEANGLNAQPIFFSAEYNRFCDAPDFSIAIDFYREVKGGPHDGYSYYLGELCGEEN